MIYRGDFEGGGIVLMGILRWGDLPRLIEGDTEVGIIF